MTLNIDLSNSATTFIVTCTEINPVTSGSTLELNNLSTNVSYSFILPDDSSSYTTRYNQFDLPTSTFSGLTEGTYSFQIKDSNEGITEEGLLKVINGIYTPDEEVDNNYVFIPSTDEDDDYIVYE
jgi:hypothetical protein